jgi:hypothetical protein
MMTLAYRFTFLLFYSVDTLRFILETCDNSNMLHFSRLTGQYTPETNCIDIVSTEVCMYPEGSEILQILRFLQHQLSINNVKK